MSLKKLIVFVLGCCVFLAPVGVSALPYVGVAVLQDQEFACSVDHASEVSDMADVDAPRAGLCHAGSKVSHACCTNLLGMVSPVARLQIVPSSNERVPFYRSLSLVLRPEGLYRPPRQAMALCNFA